MSFSSKVLLRPISNILILLGIVVLAGCSFAPVYSNPGASSEEFNFSFAQGTSRLEQIVYSDLISHFGRSERPDSKHVKIVVSSSSITPGTGSVGLQGVITITQSDTDNIVFSGTRTASATYVTSGQSLANQQAANEASERAAHQLAQTIRLTLIGIMSFSSPQ